MLVSSNGNHTTFVKYDGTVWTTGYNINGELGNDSDVNENLVQCISKPTLKVDEKQIILANIGDTKEIEVKADSGLNLLRSTIEAGENTYKSLNENVATVTNINNAHENDDTSNPDGGVGAQRNIAQITAKGPGETYIKITNEVLGTTTTVKVVVPHREGMILPKIVGGQNHFVALKADGSVWTWGYNRQGQLGLGNTANSLEPADTNQKDVIDVAAGAYFTAILKKDGTVWVAGQNSYGQLGQGNTVQSNEFIQVKSENGLDYLKDIIAITAGYNNMAALKKDGTVYTWGYNGQGQLGDNTNINKKLPVRVRKVNNIMDISAGDSHLILLDSDGTVWATGYGRLGQLGNGKTTNTFVPIKVLNTEGTAEIANILKISAGGNNTLLLGEDGKIYAFGQNSYGNLGLGNTSQTLLPTLSKDSTGEVITNAVDMHTIANTSQILRKDGSVWIAGYNGYGIFANGNTNTYSREFTKILGEGGQGEFTNGILVGSTSNTLVVADNIGKVYTSGYNGNGELGNKTTISSKFLVGIGTTSIEVKEPIMTIQGVGSKKQIEAKINLGFNILYKTLENENYTYKSANPKIATVDENGIVTGVKYGSTCIEVTNTETEETATVVVNVVREGCIANPKVESGYNHTVALKGDGTVWTWGYNGYGQLGLGDTTLRTEPTKVDIEGVVDIVCEGNHTLLLKQDGTVWAMGLNNYGQLGNNTTRNSTIPVQVQGLTNAIRIATGSNHSLALKSDGTVWSWGYNGYGVLGDGTTYSRAIPVQVKDIKGIREIAAGGHTSLALDNDGNVYSWGQGNYGQLGIGTTGYSRIPQKVGVENIAQIAEVMCTSYFVTEEGEVYSCGYNANGQLGISNTSNQTLPKKVILEDGTPLKDIEYVAGKAQTVLAKTKDGELYAWGHNGYAQIPNAETSRVLNPVKLKYSKEADEITEVLDMSAGGEFDIFVKEDGTVWTNGRNHYGQLGDKTIVNKKEWQCISTTDIEVEEKTITINKIGDTYELAPKLTLQFNLLYDEMLNGNYTYTSKNTDIAQVSEQGVITGLKRGKAKIQITEETTRKTIYVDVYVLEENDVAFPQIVTQGSFTVALKSDGTVWTWGYNGHGTLGLGDTVERVAPTKVDIEDVVKISTSQYHVLALKKDGTVWAWGYNRYGELGNGNNTISYIPVQVKGKAGEEHLNDIIEISAGTHLSMALDKYGKVYTWGYNGYGQLGNGTTSTRYIPGEVIGLPSIRKIEAGVYAGYAITDEGIVYSWGYNANGRLGDGTGSNRYTPTLVKDLSNIVEISASIGAQVVALKDDGTAWGWGYNYGNTGTLTDVSGSIPRQLLGIDGNRMNNINTIIAGNQGGLAITNEGKVLAWGSNGYGELGNGTKTNSIEPKYVMETKEQEMTKVAIIARGANYSIFAKENGEVWGTGYNGYGQIGNYSKSSTKMPENIGKDYISTEEIELTFNEINQTKKINAKYNYGFNLYNKEVSEEIEYTSQDENIAIVDNEGNVTAKGVGKTYIDITSGELARRIEINVLEQGEVAVMDVKAGAYHTVTLKTDGTIWGFGYNVHGQLGIGTDIERTNEPMQITIVGAPFAGIQDGSDTTVPEIKFTKIATGNTHTLALDTEGNVYSFGQNGYGQLGIQGISTNIHYPTKIEGLENIVKIGAFEHISIALDKDGNVYVWGNGFGVTPTKLNFHSKVIDISRKLILSENGTVWKIDDLNGKISGLTNIVEIASGNSHNLALSADGKVYSWGNNSYGQLGTGNTVTNYTPTLVDIKNENDTPILGESVKCGEYSSSILTREGEIYSFGYNRDNRIGIETATDIKTPTKVEGTNIQRMSTGLSHGIYVTDDGKVYTCGYNGYGQLGQKDYVSRKVPTLIGEAKITPEEKFITIKENEEHEISATLANTFNLRKEFIASEGFNFKSINSNIATVEDGKIIGKNSGITTIIVEHEKADKSANIYVEVLAQDEQSVIDIKASQNFTIALKADGSVWSFGQNSNGQLALKDNKNYNEPQKIELDVRARQIAVGSTHTVILTSEGKVLASGYNGKGQLGNGTTTRSNTLVKVLDIKGQEIENIAYISAKGNTTYLLDYDGNVYEIGEITGGYRRLATKLEGLEEIAQISGNYGITKDNKVINLSTKQIVEGLENIIKISAGVNHTVFLTKEGTAYAIGENGNGQCGNGTKAKVITPSVIKDSTGTNALSNIKDISAGNNFTIAVLENGEVYTWGSNENNKLGREQASDQILPKKLGEAVNGIMVSAGYNHAIYVNTEGRVYAWGNGVNGTLGNGVNGNSVTPVLVGSEEIAVSTNHVTIAKGEKSTLTSGLKSFNLIKDIVEGDMTYTSNDKQIITIDEKTGEITALKEGNASITVSQVGKDNVSNVQVTVIKSGTKVKPSVNTVNSTQVMLKADGTVWTYGLNANGELGIGNTTSSDNLSQVTFNNDVKIIEIAVGEKHIVALDENGNVWTWGANNNYQLGISNTNTIMTRPQMLNLGEKIVKIAAGYNQTFAITEENKLIAWGLNTNGELGIGTTESKVLPRKVETMKNVLDVKAGKSHTVVVTTNGEIWTTGNNSFGSLAGTDYKRNTFALVGTEDTSNTDMNIVYISAGEYHNLALTTNGKLYVWGYNVYGQLGINTGTIITEPTQIKDINGIHEISAGKSHSIILTKEGKIYATGLNSLGQFGNGNKENTKEFTQIDNISDVFSMVAGNTYSMFIKEDGTVWAMGDYYHGTSANRTTSNSIIPVQIGKQNFSIIDNDIAVNKNNTKQLNINSQFEYNAFKDNISNKNYTYKSLNTDIATVDETGKVTGKEIGTTWVKVTDTESLEEQVVIIRVIEEDNKVAPKVSGGQNYASILKADGGIWSFGYNSNGELGNSTFATSNIPKEINILKTYKDIKAGNKFTLILRNDGSVWGVGDNQYGQLGLGNRNTTQKPTLIQTLGDIVKISTGSKHSVAINKYGEVYTWGANESGQLGTNSKDTKDTPTRVSIPQTANIIDVVAGNTYTALVDSNGDVYVIGNVAGIESTEPVLLKGITKAVKVAGGEELIVLTKTGNVVKAGETNETVYNLKNAVDIAAKDGNYMILTNGGQLYVFGKNSNGELGLGNNSNVETPTLVENIGTVIGIGAGSNNTYYIDNTGLVYGAGLNTYGSIGNETTENSNTYTLVGKREFTVTPDNVLMSTNDIVEFSIDSERYNVLKQDIRGVEDFEWTTNDENIVTIEEPAKIKAIAEGETTLTVKAKDTQEEKEVVIVVEPLEAQRLEKLSVNKVEAKVTGIKKYEVTIATDDNTGELVVTTKDKTDKIMLVSADENAEEKWYENGMLTETIDLTEPVTEIPIKVQTENGTEFEYTLTVIKHRHSKHRSYNYKSNSKSINRQ